MKVVFSNTFERDVKRLQKRSLDMALLKVVLQKIIDNADFEPKYRLHRLSGEYYGMFECHIKPDWLLIWMIDGEYAVLQRTGSHSDLFD